MSFGVLLLALHSILCQAEAIELLDLYRAWAHFCDVRRSDLKLSFGIGAGSVPFIKASGGLDAGFRASSARPLQLSRDGRANALPSH